MLNESPITALLGVNYAYSSIQLGLFWKGELCKSILDEISDKTILARDSEGSHFVHSAGCVISDEDYIVLRYSSQPIGL